MKKIEKAAVCFMAQDIATGSRQLESIEKSQLSFEMVPYLSAERNAVLYSSFSQMINEAIDDTDCEFMIFINPKTIATAQDLNFIIDRLSSGYCFASLFGFAFCGFSKQLVREIGMLDESFVAGEYEDNDFLLRMRILGKAIWWGQDWSKYEYYKSKCPPARGSSLAFFWKKWRWTGDSARYLIFREKKISRRHSSQNIEISDSWGEWESSWGEGAIWDSMSRCALDCSGWTESEEDASIEVSYRFIDGSFRVSMNSDRETAISFFLTTEGRIPIYMHLVYQNTWHMAHIAESSAELRLYHDGNTIYINRISLGDEGTIRFFLPSSICRK